MLFEKFKGRRSDGEPLGAGIGARAAGVDRRSFFQLAGLAGLGAADLRLPKIEEASSKKDAFGVLIDTTRCLGCRTCEKACAQARGFPEPPGSYQTATSEKQWTVVQRYERDEKNLELGRVFVKRQCMHCIDPACASACLTKALVKTEEGPVIWRENKCMGCRFCMVSCPFDMPKFEYDSPVPKIQKCSMCFERLGEGEQPLCADECPAEAITFGRRDELLAEARKRIVESPSTYVDHIYGEHEVGGTSVMYLAAVPFDGIGFSNKLGNESYPSFTKEFLYGVPVILTLVPAFLLAVSHATRNENAHEAQGANDVEDDSDVAD